MSVRPAKTQISLGIRAAKDPSFLHADSEGSDAKADLGLRWAHTHFVGFVMSRLKYTLHKRLLFLLSWCFTALQHILGHFGRGQLT